MPTYIPVAAVAFGLAIYWQYASWELLKTIQLQHPYLHAELGRPRYGVVGTPFLNALTRFLFTDLAKHTDSVLHQRVRRMRGVAAVMVTAFIMLGVLTGLQGAA